MGNYVASHRISDRRISDLADSGKSNSKRQPYSRRCSTHCPITTTQCCGCYCDPCRRNLACSRDSAVDALVALRKNLWILSSVNEREAPYSPSISAVIHEGCGSEPDIETLGLGDIHPHACTGPYARYGISHVVNMALIVIRNYRSKEPCRFGTPNFAECMNRVLTTTFSNDFSLIEQQPSDGLIVPAVTTVRDGLPKDVFYDTFTDSLLQSLQETLSDSETSFARTYPFTCMVPRHCEMANDTPCNTGFNGEPGSTMESNAPRKRRR